MAIRVERKTTITLTGTTVGVGDLIDVLEEFPRNAIVHFNYHQGYDQRDHSYLTIDVEVPKPTTLNPGPYAPGTR